MGIRRSARELALRILFQVDVGKLPLEEVLEVTFEEEETRVEPSAREFALILVRGTLQNQKEIDALLSRYATGWDLDRLANVDRTLLRIAAYEILHLPHIPPPVVIDEAVEIAKKYSTADSGRFINGVLGTLLREHGPDKKGTVKSGTDHPGRDPDSPGHS
ncbi:MAG: transcription antitermination factor NusB [Armatimonadetes bacterium]|nr:transcription antitermination factor NusB [Armatimonadota bacterium]